jgi:hypothetical protein
MPWPLAVLVAWLGLQLVVDVAVLATPSEGALGPAWIDGLGIAIDVAILLGLATGSDAVRRLVRLACAVGLAFDTVTVGQWWMYGGSGASWLGALVIALWLGSAFGWWALGHPDVRTWMFERWLARTRV